MLISELRFALSVIASEEEASNWEAVEAISERTYVRLTTEEATLRDYPQEDVIAYLAGFGRRRTDPDFAEKQRDWLRTFLGQP